MPTKAISSPAAPRSAPVPAQHPDADFVALRARAGRAGYSVMRTCRADGTTIFVVSRWGMLRELDVAALKSFVDRVSPP